jgi:hypothetical protein
MKSSTTTRPAARKQVARSEGYHFDRELNVWKKLIVDGKQFCIFCNTWKPLDDYSRRNGLKNKINTYCKACQRIRKAMHRYSLTAEQVTALYSKQSCDCCGSAFKTQQQQHIHHVGDKVLGAVCLTCNHLLRDQSEEHPHRLQCVVEFANRVKI